MSARATVRLLLLCHICCVPVVWSATLTKEYICRDPDTGSLHEVNTTWRSTTFCGNYICKIKRKDESQQPSKLFVSLFNPQAKSNTNDNATRTSEFSLNNFLPELSRDNDRLLNKAEIHKITELLHSVKKSDLQAIIELYNVAKEIYKDMKVTDTEVDSKLNKAAIGDSKNAIPQKTSYWYTPVNEHKKPGDMITEGSDFKGTVASYVYSQPIAYAKSLTNQPSYFTGSLLSNGDFRRVGYANSYNRHGLPSYYEQRSAYNVQGTTQPSPCNPCTRSYQYPTPLHENYLQKPPSNTYPYPLTYNYTTNGYNNNYKGNPWTFYDYYKFPYQKTLQMHTNSQTTGKTVEESNVITDTKEDKKSWKTDPLSDEIINDIRANIAQREKLINIPLKKRIKLERVSKIIKLNQNERVTRSISGKVEREDSSSQRDRKVDSENSSQETAIKASIKEKRSNRDVQRLHEIYETYVERVTCEPPTEPGFFKVGNMTKPFPDCCPQRIEAKHR